MVKCAKCLKTVTKKTPGIQCSKCSKWMHGECTSISEEQLNVLYNTDSIDWKCRGCTGTAKPKRVSCILPDADAEDASSSSELQYNTLTRKIMSDIRQELREVVQQELQTTLQFFSDKIDEYQKKLSHFENTVKDIKNNLKNIVLKNDALELKMNVIQQNLIVNNIELCGVCEQGSENIMEIAKKIAIKMDQAPEDIVKVYRKKSPRPNNGNDSSPSPVIISLKDGCKEAWLQSSKNTNVSCQDLGLPQGNKIFLRESLTPATAYLLWKSKTELKKTNLYKFVWCKNGVILARKHETDKIHHIRSSKDIERLVNLATIK